MSNNKKDPIDWRKLILEIIAGVASGLIVELIMRILN